MGARNLGVDDPCPVTARRLGLDVCHRWEDERMAYFANCSCGWLSPAVSMVEASRLGQEHVDCCGQSACVQRVTDRDDHLPSRRMTT